MAVSRRRKESNRFILLPLVSMASMLVTRYDVVEWMRKSSCRVESSRRKMKQSE